MTNPSEPEGVGQPPTQPFPTQPLPMQPYPAPPLLGGQQPLQRAKSSKTPLWIALGVVGGLLAGCIGGAAIGSSGSSTKTTNTAAAPAATVTAMATETVTATPTAAATTAKPSTPKPTPKPAPTFDDQGGDVTAIVGEDIPAGVWTVHGADSSCYWEITRDGHPEDIINNNIGGGTQRVTLKKGQDFESQGCGAWKKS